MCCNARCHQSHPLDSTFGNHRESEADDINPLLQHLIGKLHGQPSVPQHHRHNGMRVTLCSGRIATCGVGVAHPCAVGKW